MTKLLELRGCPFCGGEPYTMDGYEWDEGLSIGCHTCWLVMGGFDNKDEAITAWNRRDDDEVDSGEGNGP